MLQLSSNEIWVVAYINRDYISRVNHDLIKFPEVEVYIPTVKILKKQSKGKNIFEEIPLLFNYGFFKLPFHLASNPEYLVKLKSQVSCIYAWMKNPGSNLAKKPDLDIKNEGMGELPEENNVRLDLATVTEKEIAELIKSSEKYSVFSDIDESKLTPGKTLILQGYPFENVPAEVVAVHKNTQEVTVKLLLENMMAEVKVSFDNIFYTVYSNYNVEDILRESSLDQIAEKGNRVLDKIYAKINYE